VVFDHVTGIGTAPASRIATSIRFGYAAITWGGKDEQAIDDIASVGFHGIQLRANILPTYADRPEALKDLLDAHHLTLVAFSSGNLSIDPATEREQLALHLRNATFVKRVGGLHLQIIDERPRGRAVDVDDYARLGRLLTELGKRTSDLGVPLAYHPHMGAIGERPEQIRAILRATDPRYVRLLLDTAHYQQGGGDPASAIKEYADQLALLHIKDLQSPLPGDSPSSYRFVELGRGKVDFKRVFDALAEIQFDGWGIVELDAVSDRAMTPKDAAIISRKYLETLGFRI
jgi:inosose dehydratase